MAVVAFDLLSKRIGSGASVGTSPGEVRWYENAGGALSNSNLTFSAQSSSSVFYAGHLSDEAGAGPAPVTRVGKQYVEFVIGGTSKGTMVGVLVNTLYNTGTSQFPGNPFGDVGAYLMTNIGYFGGNIGLINNGSNQANSAYNYNLGDVVGIAVDWNTFKVWFSRNGTWIVGNPATGASPTFTLPSAAFSFYGTAYTYSNLLMTLTVQAKASNQTYAPPTGFAPYKTGGAATFATHTSLATDTLYTVQGTSIVPLFQGTAQTGIWRSKVMVLNQQPSFGWARVEGDYPCVLRTYGDGVLHYTTPAITSNVPVRLPVGRFREWYVEVESAARVVEVVLATTSQELVR